MKTPSFFPSLAVRPLLAAVAVAAAALLPSQPAQAQYQQQSRSGFVIKKVETGFPTSPDIGGASDIRWKPSQWLKVEVTFETVADFTEELTFNFYVYYVDKGVQRLFVGRTNYVNIFKNPPGQPLHAVMYMSPKTIQRLLQNGNKPFVATSFNTNIQQISVTINQPGIANPLAVGNLKTGGQEGWWNSMKQEEGFLVKKSETPFAPFYWDYYETEKTANSR